MLHERICLPPWPTGLRMTPAGAERRRTSALLFIASCLATMLASCSSPSPMTAPSPVESESAALCLPALPTGADPSWTLRAASVKCDTPHLYQVVSHISAASPPGQVKTFCTPQVVARFVSAPKLTPLAFRFFSAIFYASWLDGSPSIVCLVGLTNPLDTASQMVTYSVRQVVDDHNAADYMFCRDQSGNVSVTCKRSAARYANVADLYLDSRNSFPGTTYLNSFANSHCPPAMRANMINPNSSDWLFVLPTAKQWKQRTIKGQQAHIDCFLSIENLDAKGKR